MITREEFDNYLLTLDRDGYSYMSTYFTMGTYNKSPLSVSWNTGGMSGGSCWGTEAEYYHVYDGEEVEKLEQLEDNLTSILNKFVPNITIPQYREISKMKDSESYTNTEYYGNYDEYTRVSISEDKLFEFINQINA